MKKEITNFEDCINKIEDGMDKYFYNPQKKNNKKEKKYTVKIEYIEGKDYQSMQSFVNGKKSPIPPKLKKWIARDYVNELFYKSDTN